MEKTNYLAIIFQILSAAFLITGVFFINDSSKIYFPVLFLGLSLISEIILRNILIKQMQNLDKIYLTGISIEKQLYYQFYERFEDYKKKMILANMNIIFSLIIIIFIVLVTLLNNIYNAFLILVPLIISVIDLKFVEPIIKKKIDNIIREEKEIKTIQGVDMYLSQLGGIHYKSYQIGRINLIKKYVYLAIILLTALLTTIFNNTFSLPYVIFYFAIGYMLFEQYMNFMKYPETKRELLVSKVRLHNITKRM